MHFDIRMVVGAMLSSILQWRQTELQDNECFAIGALCLMLHGPSDKRLRIQFCQCSENADNPDEARPQGRLPVATHVMRLLPLTHHLEWDSACCMSCHAWQYQIDAESTSA